jgi:hypothetical protein
MKCSVPSPRSQTHPRALGWRKYRQRLANGQVAQLVEQRTEMLSGVIGRDRLKRSKGRGDKGFGDRAITRDRSNRYQKSVVSTHKLPAERNPCVKSVVTRSRSAVVLRSRRANFGAKPLGQRFVPAASRVADDRGLEIGQIPQRREPRRDGPSCSSLQIGRLPAWPPPNPRDTVAPWRSLAPAWR